MKAGTEDKKKVLILAGLLVVIVPAAIWELYGYFVTPAPRPVPAQVVTTSRASTNAPARVASAGSSTAAPDAQKVSSNNIDPTLHLDKLAMSEEVEYAGTGRNIFSAESVPVHIDQPIAPPRPGPDVVTTAGPPPPPQAPPIDLKYFGYSQAKDKSNIRAFLVHGDDIFMAKSGEIVDHRYKIGSISPGSIQVTDLSYNNTQSLPLMQ
jgi:hypothetical protein